MESLAGKRQADLPDRIADRYRVNGVVGQGGMAVVYKVYDTSTGRHLALKQLTLRKNANREESVEELFEREFHTLVHLSHPRVVAVYDYGIDDAVPYYTMELLDGGDLRDLSPLDWRKACRLLLDVCSALALLHSRKMVHRDLSPRNVRCTTDGLAKLIDFGGMIPMGPSIELVGTPPLTPPEAVHLQALDARTDLYSLGATLYRTLTGRHAYPAQDFKQLPDRWRVRPAPPSELVAGIPKGLDTLVMSLIHLDPAVRPASAAEVMERLSAIVDTRLDEQLLVSQAYLCTPALVGREQSLAHVRKQLSRARRARGNALIAQGASGVGRSRFMDACVLEGKLAGATVLHARASDGRDGDYGAVRRLAQQLLDAVPKEALEELKPRVGVLAHVLPELLDRCPGYALQPIEDPLQIRPRVQNELRDWMIAVSRHRPLLIVLDDVHHIDEPSAAFVALLAHGAAEHSVLVAVSAETGAPWSSEAALKLWSHSGKKIRLRNLSGEETQALLGSIFGEVPNLQLVSHRLHQISRGNPRDVMQLAQHLVDNQTVGYRAGAWTLPERIDAGDLPAGMAQALSARVASLTADALALAQTIALSPEQSFSFEECRVLTEHGEALRLMRSLDELVAAEVLKSEQDRYSLGQKGWVSALKADGDQQKEKASHLKLARVFELRGQEPFRVAQHLMRAGEEKRGLDVFIEFSEQSADVTATDPEAYSRLLRSLPPGWFETFMEAIKLCKKLNRPLVQVHTLQTRLSGLHSLLGGTNTEYLGELIERLRHYSGLAFYHELDDSMEPSARLRRALELAQEHYESSPEQEWVLEPAAALHQLARVLIAASGMLAVSYDVAFQGSLPSLQPLVALSPSFWAVDKLLFALGHRIKGRYEVTLREYRQLLERTEEPDGAGLDPTYRKYTRLGVMRACGMVKAGMGLSSALELASELETDPLYEVNALQIRMLYHLWQGNIREAQRCNQNLELLQIQKTPTQVYENSHLSRKLTAYALSDDLTGVKRITGSIRKMAAKFPAWVPVLHYAKGEYQRIRGDYRGAAAELERAMKLTAPGRHHNWVDIAAAYLSTLLELRQYDEVKALAEDWLSAVEREKLGYVRNYLKMPLALAQAKLGEYESAVQNAEAAIEGFDALGSTGLNLGLAYETRARVAVYAKNVEAYRKYASLCAEQFCTKGNRALNAKYEKLEQESYDPDTGFSEMEEAARLAGTNQLLFLRSFTDQLNACQGFEERAQRILEVLVQRSNTRDGYLYTMQKDGPVLSAQTGNAAPPEDMLAAVQKTVAAELDEDSDVTATNADFDSRPGTTSAVTEQGGERCRFVLLGHDAEQGFAVTGVAVLVLNQGSEFDFPAVLAPVVSQYLLNSGDAAARVVAHSQCEGVE